MQWEFIVALVIAIPIILIPPVFVWYINIGGILAANKVAQGRQAAQKERGGAVAESEQYVAKTTAKEQHAEKKLVGTKR
jgi:hypothetical protein